MAVIDCHHHVWWVGEAPLTTFRPSWGTSLNRDFTPDDPAARTARRSASSGTVAGVVRPRHMTTRRLEYLDLRRPRLDFIRAVALGLDIRSAHPVGLRPRALETLRRAKEIRRHAPSHQLSRPDPRWGCPASGCMTSPGLCSCGNRPGVGSDSQHLEAADANPRSKRHWPNAGPPRLCCINSSAVRRCRRGSAGSRGHRRSCGRRPCRISA